jgi:hypothetical protein
LDIEIVNGKGIPTGDAMWDLGKTLAGEVKRALRDTAEYDLYIVSFATEYHSGLSYSKSSKSREFLSREL